MGDIHVKLVSLRFEENSKILWFFLSNDEKGCQLTVQQLLEKSILRRQVKIAAGTSDCIIVDESILSGLFWKVFSNLAQRFHIASIVLCLWYRATVLTRWYWAEWERKLMLFETLLSTTDFLLARQRDGFLVEIHQMHCRICKIYFTTKIEKHTFIGLDWDGNFRTLFC